MTLTPNQNYRFVFKQGMSGWDIETIQIALNELVITKLVEDGIFGPLTAGVAENVQRTFKITVDGIVGPQTQNTICSYQSGLAEKSRTPVGLVRGICFGESGGIIPTTSAQYANGSRDYGPFQENMIHPIQQQLNEAYRPGLQARNVASYVNSRFKEFFGKPGAKTEEEAWRLAILNYNWPAAAVKIAAGEGETWIYNYEGKQYKMSDPAPWVEIYGITGVSTGWEWVKWYVDSKAVFITSWTIAK